MTMNRSRRGAILGVSVVIAGGLLLAPARAEVPAMQVVTASGGAVAGGLVPDAKFPDGSTRAFNVLLTVPEGSVTATAPAGAVDLAKPWVVFTEEMVDNPDSGHADGGREVCGTVTNPTRWNRGVSTAAAAWNGAFVDVACDDGAGYSFYRVRWDVGPHWLVSNPVVPLHMGGQPTRWSGGGMTGIVQLWPETYQHAAFTVCGFRPPVAGRPGAFDCFANSPSGSIVPSNKRIVAQAQRVPSQ